MKTIIILLLASALIQVSNGQTTASDSWTPLPMALDEGQFSLAKSLLKNTNDYTFRNRPLIVYFADGVENSSEIIDFLIKEGINKEYYTQAFVQSVLYNDSAGVRLLLDAGADISITVKVIEHEVGRGFGKRPAENDTCANILHYATSPAMARLLIKRGANIREKTMLKYAWQNPPLLHALEEVSVHPPISPDDLNLLLAYAAGQGDIKTVEYALKRGANVNSYQLPPSSEEEYGNRQRNIIYKQTPLIRNAKGGCRQYQYRYDTNSKILISPRIAELLLNAGADPNIADADGRTALHYTAKYQCQAGAGPTPMGSRRDRENGAHFDSFTQAQYYDSIAHLLIQRGANLNIRDSSGCTPMILAVMAGNYEILKMLLEARADITIKDNRGRDALFYLKRTRYSNDEIMSFFEMLE